MDKKHLLSMKVPLAALKDWSIAGKLLLLVLAPFGIALTVILTLTIVGLNRLEADTSTNLLQEEVRIISQRFTEQQADLQASAALLTADPILLDAIERNDQAALQGYLISASIRSGFNHLQILGRYGRTLSVIQDFDPTTSAADLEQLNSLGLLEVEAMRLVPTPNGWLLTVVRPIKSQSGLVGVLSVGRLLNASALAALNFERTNPRLAVFDAQGGINAVTELETQDDQEYLFNIDHNLWSQALNGQVLIGQATMQGELQRVAYAPLAVENRPVAVFSLSLSTEETTNLRDQLVVTNLLVGGGTALLTILGALILARNFMTRPINALITSAEQVAAGRLDVLVPGATNRDEIGHLAAAFNKMTDQLRQTLERLDRRTKALATSAEVSRRLAAILDPRELASEVVNEVRNAFDYYYAQIYLLDEAGENLVIASGTGEAGAAMVARGHSVPKGRGLVGRAADTNTSVLIPDVSHEEGWLPNELLPETKAEASIPISVGNQVLGVLDVQHNLVNGLTSEDVTLLESLAGQVAISLRNARSYEQSRSQAEMESLVNVIGQKIQRTTSVEDTLQTAIRELGSAIGASRVRVSLKPASSVAATEPIRPVDSLVAEVESKISKPEGTLAD
jgi:putative methionine-R-sulfoxide reductase with GAF domain